MATPSPGGAVSRLALKQTPLDTWSTREHLALASAVVRSGDQNWMSVSRAMRGLADPGRPPDWCSQKNCAQQYARLLERVDTPRRKRERGESNDTPGESIVRRLRQDRTDELRRQVADTRTAYAALKAQIRQLRSGQLDARLDEIQREIQAEKDAAAQETERQRQWLADREAQKLAVQEALRAQVTKAPPPKRRKLTLDPRDSSPSEAGSVLSEADFVDSPASEAPAAEMSGDETSRDATETRPAPASPLLTSLLRSPSAGRPGVAVAAAAAAAGVSEAGASAPPAGSPTLSRLLELPPGTPGHAALPRTNLFPEQKTEPNGETPAPAAAAGEQKAAVEVKQEPGEVATAATSGTSTPAAPAAQRVSALAEPAASSVTEIKVEPPPSEETSSSKEESAAESDSGVSDRVAAETTTPAADPAADATDAAAATVAATPVATASPVKAVSTSPPAASGNAPAAATVKPPAAAATAVAASANTTAVTATPTAAAATTAAVAAPAASSAAAASVSTSSASDKAFNDMMAAAASVTEEKTTPVTESAPDPEVTKMPDAAQPEAVRRSSDAEPKAAPETAVKEVKTDPEPESTPAPEPVPAEAEVEAAPEPPAPEDEVVATGGGGDGPGASAPAPAVVKQEPVDTEGEEDVPVPAQPAPAAEEVTPRPPPPPVKEEREESDADSAASSQAPCTSRARSVSARSEPASQESVPNSPASGVLSGDDDERRDYKLWKKSILLLWREFAAHRHASKFARPITNDQASNYRAIVKSPMDLAQLKRNVETGVVTTTPQFQRDMMLMFCNAMMFNATEHEVHRFALEMQTECVEKLQLLTSGDQPAGPAVKRRETRESSRDEMKRKRSTDERPTPTRKRR